MEAKTDTFLDEITTFLNSESAFSLFLTSFSGKGFFELSRLGVVQKYLFNEFQNVCLLFEETQSSAEVEESLRKRLFEFAAACFILASKLNKKDFFISEVERIAISQGKIDAIKFYREEKKSSLLEAKNFVESLASEKGFLFKEHISPSIPTSIERREIDSSDIFSVFGSWSPTWGSRISFEAQVREKYELCSRLSAVKLVREVTKCSLKEAVDFTNNLAKERGYKKA